MYAVRAFLKSVVFLRYVKGKIREENFNMGFPVNFGISLTKRVDVVYTAI